MNRLFEYSEEKLFYRSACSKFQRCFKFVVMADSRVDHDPNAKEILVKALKMAAEYDPLFILHGGDIVWTGNKDSFAYFRMLINQIPELDDIPIFVVVGNHEKSIMVDDKSAFQYFEKLIGPLNFAMCLPQQHLTICGMNTADYRAYPNALTRLNYSLECYDQPIKFIFTHIPPYAGAFENFQGFSNIFHPQQRSNTLIGGTSELLKVLSNHNVTMGFSGHIHAYIPTIIDLPYYVEPNPITGRAAIPWIVTGGAGAEIILGYSFHFIVITVKFQGSNNFTIQPEVVPIFLN
jgi:3',5'-cyclic-AMP phosphodiesterase